MSKLDITFCEIWGDMAAKEQVCSGLFEIWPIQCENLNTFKDSGLKDSRKNWTLLIYTGPKTQPWISMAEFEIASF